MIIILGICIGIIIFLIVKLNQKHKFETYKYNNYQEKLNDITKEYHNIEGKLQAAEAQYANIIKEYHEATACSQAELDEFLSAQREMRQQEIDEYFKKLWEEKQEQLELKKQQAEQSNEEYINDIRTATERLREQNERIQNETQDAIDFCRNRFEAILEPLKQYEKDQQAKLYYTIQIPEEYREDINFLLTTVNQKVRHPDVISKLVWTEYIRPYILETFKRVGIENKPGIYKITNLKNGKAYIGKSTDIKKRLADHFKSAIGIQSIANQEVHYALLNEGLWNWTIECIIYCDKEKLNELEKYYIDFFKTQEYGYNRNSGGGG